jgi:type II secretion system protein I
MSTGRRRGFTLIEALVAVALLTGGIVAVLGSLGAMARTEARFRDQEQMQRLAVQKLDELVATIDVGAASESGDFKDQGEDRFVWSSDVGVTGVENLTAVTVTVRHTGSSETGSPDAKVTSLVYLPPATDTGAAQ